MEPPVDQPPIAWQPLTPLGVGLFARAKVRRLFLVQFLAALCSAAAFVWALNVCWFPTIVSAIDQLPSKGSIQGGRLSWLGQSSQMLAESRFLAFTVDLTHTGQARSPAHLQIEFGQTNFLACSVLGCLQIPYPPSYTIGFNLQQLKPWWGAWAPIILALVGMAVVLGLMLCWCILATLYCLPAWLLALYSDRELTLSGSWRLAGASLVPGALMMTVAFCLYRLAQIDPLRLMAAFALHFLLGWVYLVLGTLASPKLGTSFNRRTNPFRFPTAGQKQAPDQAADRGRANPFHPSRD
jgi:hypothetical protein